MLPLPSRWQRSRVLASQPGRALFPRPNYIGGGVRRIGFREALISSSVGGQTGWNLPYCRTASGRRVSRMAGPATTPAPPACRRRGLAPTPLYPPIATDLLTSHSILFHACWSEAGSPCPLRGMSRPLFDVSRWMRPFADCCCAPWSYPPVMSRHIAVASKNHNALLSPIIVPA